jgi:hypothetical protein
MAANTPLHRGSHVSAIVETPRSGVWEIGDQITYTQEYEGKYADCVSAIVFKGVFGSGATAGLRCRSSKVTKDRGAKGMLTVVWEAYGSSSGATLPADKFDLQPFDINPDLFQHPYWVAATALTTAEREALLTYRNAQSDTQYAQTRAVLTGSKATIFLDLLKKGIQNYQFSAFKYTYTFASWTIPTLNRKAYIEAAGGPLTSTLSGLSSLRVSDSMSNSQGYYEVTRTWLVGAAGYWDTTLYASANAP